MYYAGKDVFTGMLLHTRKALLPVDFTLDLAANGLVADVLNYSFFFRNIKNAGMRNISRVRRLTAALGEEGGSV